MRYLGHSLRTSFVLLVFAVFATAASAQRVRLAGTTHPHTRLAVDSGRANPALALDRMVLLLNATPEQDAALEALLEAQRDPASPQFQQWLSPEEFGRRFGPAPDEVDSVVAWLEDQGFSVDGVAAGRRSIEFSGTARQVESAFHTRMRRYRLGAELHTANASDIEIPAGLAGLVGGVASLHDFHAQPLHRVSEPALTPEYTTSSGVHALAPGDFATLYNVAPLWSAGVDGTGQSIAVVGRSNFNMSDVASFRSQFGLPGNNTKVVLNGKDPGILSPGEATEALLDVEWAGAVAKGAAIQFVLSANTRTTGGELLSSQFAVQNNVAPVLSSSFGLCEAQMGSENQFFNALWQQAAAQGISVVVAAGDSGSAGCDDPAAGKPASLGFGVSGLASTPWNVAVGGTRFNENGAPAAYWNAANSAQGASAKAYIPEAVWNESSATSLYAGAGGFSSIYATPAWQTGAGVPLADPAAPGAAAQHHRYLPDVSLSGAGHDPYVIVQNGALAGVGGTSAGAPSFAGIVALVNQHLAGRAGNVAPALYSIAARTPSAFHDVVTGTNAVPCVTGTPNCLAAAGSAATGTLAGFAAGPGYDLATGLGSVDAFNLVMNWPAAIAPVPAPGAAPAITSITPNSLTGSASPQTLTINGAGFKPGAKVTVSTTGSSLSVTPVSSTSAALVISVTLGTAAHTWSVQVVNPDGKASNSASFSVVAPPPPPPATAPAITTLNPNPMTGSNQPQTLTIHGTGFRAGASIVFNLGASSVVAKSGQYVLVSPTQLQISLVVGTAARNLTVQVVNSDGSSTAAVPLAVVAPAKVATH